MTDGKVLVLGDDTRSFLAIVRSLGRRGIAVHAAPANFRSPALRSRYIAGIHDLPPWTGDGVDWLTAITARLRAEQYDLVIPCNETTLLPLHFHRSALSGLARLAIPSDEAIAVLFDKHKTRELAHQVGVAVAAGRLSRAGDTAEGVLEEFGASVVIKPRHSYSLESLAARGNVEVVVEPARLDRLLSRSDLSATLIEQFFVGRGVGVSVLASRGQVLQAFEHHRVREVAGASFYRFSAPLTPDLVRACEAMVAALDYTGLAMFEFKVNTNDRWVLLEVNARPWGSMPLPVALGIDFPYRWYRLLTRGEETPAVTYRPGVYGRNLMPDLENSMIEAKRLELEPLAIMWLMLRRAIEGLRVLTGREVYDVLVRDDPRPGLIELLEVAGRVRRRLRHLLPGAAARRRRRARAHVKGLGGARDKQCIIFVCQGNICRSPFAENLLRTWLRDTPIEIGSAGMIPHPGRPIPALGLEAAAMHGLDLTTHRSAWLTRQVAEAASLLLVFDEFSRTSVLDRYPDLKVPIFLLGDLTGLGEISDPIDGDAATFRLVYNQIAAAIAELAVLMRPAL